MLFIPGSRALSLEFVIGNRRLIYDWQRTFLRFTHHLPDQWMRWWPSSSDAVMLLTVSVGITKLRSWRGMGRVIFYFIVYSVALVLIGLPCSSILTACMLLKLSRTAGSAVVPDSSTLGFNLLLVIAAWDRSQQEPLLRPQVFSAESIPEQEGCESFSATRASVFPKQLGLLRNPYTRRPSGKTDRATEQGTRVRYGSNSWLHPFPRCIDQAELQNNPEMLQIICGSFVFAISNAATLSKATVIHCNDDEVILTTRMTNRNGRRLIIKLFVYFVWQKRYIYVETW